MTRAFVQMDGGSFCCGFPFRFACRLPVLPSQSASLTAPPRGEPSVPPSILVNAVVRRSCEQVCLTTAWPPPTGVHLPRPVGEVAQDAPADCDGEGNRQASLTGEGYNPYNSYKMNTPSGGRRGQ